MIALYIEVPFASFRKSYARSLAETYPFPPPATIYGMLLSLVGEWYRSRHQGVKLAFAYKKKPLIATTLRKLSRYKYGVASKQLKLGNSLDYVETLCNIEFICWIDSSEETQPLPLLETRVLQAVQHPEQIERKGLVSLGLSDDTVNDISLLDLNKISEKWYWLTPSIQGEIELPIWVDHVGSIHTHWQSYDFASTPSLIKESIEQARFTKIVDPR
ncbi:MAG: type I-MYXAN CRISPR-associated protein Cas5/Cmx5/DevS [Cyanobacteria bacterium J06621_8]